MNTLKNLLVVVGMAFGISAFALADAGAEPITSGSQVALTEEAASAPTLDATDTAFAFKDAGQPMQVAALSAKEMEATEGAYFNYFLLYLWLRNPILALLYQGAVYNPGVLLRGTLGSPLSRFAVGPSGLGNPSSPFIRNGCGGSIVPC